MKGAEALDVRWDRRLTHGRRELREPVPDFLAIQRS